MNLIKKKSKMNIKLNRNFNRYCQSRLYFDFYVREINEAHMH